MSAFSTYIGMPYIEGGQGPDAFDCMGFFRMVQGKHFGIEVPTIIAPDYDDPNVVASCFNNEERENWYKVQVPQHGDAVMVHRPLHIGLWVDEDGGGVLHCVKDIGVIFTKNAAWATSGFGRCEYYRHWSKMPKEVAA